MGFVAKQNHFALLAATAGCFFVTITAKADVSWDPTVSNGSWSVGSNWLGASIPTSGSNVGVLFNDANLQHIFIDTEQSGGGWVTIQNSGQGLTTASIDAAGTLEVDRLYIGHSGRAALVVTGGIVRPDVLNLGVAESGRGTLELSSGTISTGISTIGGDGVGVLNHTGGFHSVSDFLSVAANGAGTYLMSGGTLTVDGATQIGADTGNGRFIQSGGLVRVENGMLIVGPNSKYELTGGTLEIGSVLTLGSLVQSGGSRTAGAPDRPAIVDSLSELSGGTFTVYGLDDARGIQTGGFHAVGAVGSPGTFAPDRYVLEGNATLSVIGFETSNGFLDPSRATDFTQRGGYHELGRAGSESSLLWGTGLVFSTYFIQGGTFNVVGSELIGYTGRARVNQSGGVHRVTGNVAIAMPGTRGHYLLSGGNATFDKLFVGGSEANSGGTGSISISGGTLSILDTFKIWNTGSMLLTSGHIDINSFQILGRAVIAPGNDGNAGARSLLIEPSGALDVTTSSFEVDHATEISLDSIVQYIRIGYNHGAWNGIGGIFSSSAATGASHSVGYQDDGNNILVQYARAADANFDGAVDIADLFALASHWQSPAYWSGGDFNYDRLVDAADLTILSRNWQAGVRAPSAVPLEPLLLSLGLPLVAVPEPALCAMGSLALGLSVLSRRRRHFD